MSSAAPAAMAEDSYPVIRTIRDIEALEQIPLEERVWSWDLNDWIRRGWAIDPDKVAINYVENGDVAAEPVRITYRELALRSTQAANLFYSLGVQKEDGVLFLTPTLPQSYFSLYGGIATGISCVVNWMLKAEHLAELIRNAKTRVLVVLGPTPGYEIWENVQAIREQLPKDLHILSVQALGGKKIVESDFDDLCAKQPGDRLIFERKFTADDIGGYVHSGGTTGSPKLVRLAHRGFCYKAWAHGATGGPGRDQSIFADYPLFHVAGVLSRGILSICHGMMVMIPSALGARDKRFITNYWKFVEKYGITQFTGVPTTLSVLAKNLPTTEDVSTLKKVATSGSAPLPVETARELERALGIRVLLTYGSTEYTTGATQPPREGDPRYGSTGLRVPYTQVRPVELDNEGNIKRFCNTNELGIIVVKGPGVTPGYVDPAQNIGIFTQDGYFKSGDCGRVDEDGFLWITGRVKDLIIRGGHNIDPQTIEHAIRKHPAVLHVAAVGKPDAYAGELPVAYVQRVDGSQATAEDILKFCEAHIPERPAVPKEIYFIDGMPVTDIGKPDKVGLRFDAAKRHYSRVLGDALGNDASVAIEVGNDATHGTRVTIGISGEKPGTRPLIEKRVADLMKTYSHHFVVA
ncbi:MAG: acyl-CoA synthetase [Burkholderiales bacterium]